MYAFFPCTAQHNLAAVEQGLLDLLYCCYLHAICQEARTGQLQSLWSALQVACLKATSRSAEITLPRQLAEQFLVVERPAAHNTPYKAALKVSLFSALEAPAGAARQLTGGSWTDFTLACQNQ